jgi:hypothetical protein
MCNRPGIVLAFQAFQRCNRAESVLTLHAYLLLPVLQTCPGPYTLLDDMTNEVRLCHISSRDSTEGFLVCTLEPFSLRDAGHYKCLSYAWGVPKHSTVVLDGCFRTVSDNLHAILTRFRDDPELSSLLWIDALCVDQDSDSEKGQQVPLMSKIYENAAEVIVWLGPDQADLSGDTTAGAQQDEADTGEVFAFFEALADNVHFHELPYFTKCCEGCPGDLGVPKKSWRGLMNGLHAVMCTKWWS